MEAEDQIAHDQRLRGGSTEVEVTEASQSTRTMPADDEQPLKEESTPRTAISQDDDDHGKTAGAEEKKEVKVTDNDSSKESHGWRDDVPLPLQINHEALKHIATYFMPGNHGKCVEVVTLTEGAYHEIRELLFEDGWSCIGRLTRNRSESESVLESETATTKYVRRHTSIPVPEVYFVNTNPNHVVGAAFVLMEKLPGQHLYRFWEELSSSHKFAIMEQIADVMGQLCDLRFDSIGSVDANGEIGPLQNLAYAHKERGRGPFTNTIDYLTSFLHPIARRSEEVMQCYPQVEHHIVNFMQQKGDDSITKAPFRLIHADFDGQNMLFEQPDPDLPPRLTGIIDWDQAHSGPLYYLCEYPQFIQDCDLGDSRHLYAENRALRKCLVYCLSRHFPEGSEERRNVLECFRQKSFNLNGFRNIFMTNPWREELELGVVRSYVKAYSSETDECGDRLPYGGRTSWEPDSEFESEEDSDEEGSGDEGNCEVEGEGNDAVVASREE